MLETGILHKCHFLGLSVVFGVQRVQLDGYRFRQVFIKQGVLSLNAQLGVHFDLLKHICHKVNEPKANLTGLYVVISNEIGLRF